MASQEDGHGKGGATPRSRQISFSFPSVQEPFGVICDRWRCEYLSKEILRIASIQLGSVADVDARLRVNDEILQINGRDIGKESLHTARWILDNAVRSGSLSITVQRRKRQAPVPPTQQDQLPKPLTIPPAENQHPVLFRQKSAPPCRTARQNEQLIDMQRHLLDTGDFENIFVQKRHFSLTKIPQDVAENFTSLTSSESTLSGRDSPVFFFSDICPDLSQGPNLMMGEQGNDRSNMAAVPSTRSSKKVKDFYKIHLLKDEKGLGVQIAGGIGSRRGDIGIFIASLNPGSAAEKDGRLCRGDQILSVNGTDMTSVTHAEAVSVIRSSPNLIQLVIARKRKKLAKLKCSSTSTVSSSATSATDNEQSLAGILSPDSDREIITGSRRCSDGPSDLSSVSSYLTEVVLFKEDGVSLGIGVTCRQTMGQCALVVQDLSPTSVSKEQLRCGDEILNINSQPLDNLTPQRAEVMLRDLPSGPVSLLIRRRQQVLSSSSDDQSSCDNINDLKEYCDSDIPEEILALDKDSLENMAYRSPPKVIVIETTSPDWQNQASRTPSPNKPGSRVDINNLKKNEVEDTPKRSVKSFVARFEDPASNAKTKNTGNKNGELERRPSPIRLVGDSDENVAERKVTPKSENVAERKVTPKSQNVAERKVTPKSGQTVNNTFDIRNVVGLKSPRGSVGLKNNFSTGSLGSNSGYNKHRTDLKPVPAKRTGAQLAKPTVKSLPVVKAVPLPVVKAAPSIQNQQATASSDEEYTPVSVKGMLSKFNSPPPCESKPIKVATPSPTPRKSVSTDTVIKKPSPQIAESDITLKRHNLSMPVTNLKTETKSVEINYSELESKSNAQPPQNPVLLEILKAKEKLSKKGTPEANSSEGHAPSKNAEVAALESIPVQGHDDGFRKVSTIVRSQEKLESSNTHNNHQKSELTLKPSKQLEISSTKFSSPRQKSPTAISRPLDKLEIIPKDSELEQKDSPMCNASSSNLVHASDSSERPSNQRRADSMENLRDVSVMSPTRGGSVVRQIVERFQEQSDKHQSLSRTLSNDCGVNDVEIVTLIRLPGENLGMALHIEGNVESKVIEGVFVEEVEPGGAAERASGGTSDMQGLCYGDEILEINGTSLQDLTRSEAVSVFDALPLRIILTVRRNNRSPRFNSSLPLNDSLRTETPMIEAFTPLPGSPTGSPTFFSERSESVCSNISDVDAQSTGVPDGFEVVKFSVFKGDSESLGITIVPSYGSTRQYYQVKRILSSGVCAKDGHLRVGDRLVTCGGKTMVGVTQNTCTEVLKSASEVIHFEVLRTVNNGGNMWHTFHSLPDSNENSPLHRPRSAPDGLNTDSNIFSHSPLKLQFKNETQNDNFHDTESDDSLDSEDGVNEWSPHREMNSSLEEVTLERFMVHDKPTNDNVSIKGPQLEKSVMYDDDSSESESYDESSENVKENEPELDVGPSLQRSIMYGASSSEEEADNDGEDDENDEIDCDEVMKSFDDILMEEDSDDEIREVFVKPDFSSVKLDHITLREDDGLTAEINADTGRRAALQQSQETDDSCVKEMVNIQAHTDDHEQLSCTPGVSAETVLTSTPTGNLPSSRGGSRTRPSIFSIIKTQMSPRDDDEDIPDEEEDDIPITDIDAILSDVSSRDNSESSQASNRLSASPHSPPMYNQLPEISEVMHSDYLMSPSDDSSIIADTSAGFKQALANPFEALEKELDNDFMDETENEVDDIPKDIPDLELDSPTEEVALVTTEGTVSSPDVDETDGTKELSAQMLQSVNIKSTENEGMRTEEEICVEQEFVVVNEDASTGGNFRENLDDDVIDLDDDESYERQTELTNAYEEILHKSMSESETELTPRKPVQTVLFMKQPVQVIDLDAASSKGDSEAINHSINDDLDELSSEDEDVAEFTEFIRESVQNIVAEENRVAGLTEDVSDSESVNITPVSSSPIIPRSDSPLLLKSSSPVHTDNEYTNSLTSSGEAQAKRGDSSSILDEVLKMRSRLTVNGIEDDESGVGTDMVLTLSESVPESHHSQNYYDDDDDELDQSTDDETGSWTLEQKQEDGSSDQVDDDNSEKDLVSDKSEEANTSFDKRLEISQNSEDGVDKMEIHEKEIPLSKFEDEHYSTKPDAITNPHAESDEVEFLQREKPIAVEMNENDDSSTDEELEMGRNSVEEDEKGKSSAKEVPLNPEASHSSKSIVICEAEEESVVHSLSNGVDAAYVVDAGVDSQDEEESEVLEKEESVVHSLSNGVDAAHVVDTGVDSQDEEESEVLEVLEVVQVETSLKAVEIAELTEIQEVVTEDTTNHIPNEEVQLKSKTQEDRSTPVEVSPNVQLPIEEKQLESKPQEEESTLDKSTTNVKIPKEGNNLESSTQEDEISSVIANEPHAENNNISSETDPNLTKPVKLPPSTIRRSRKLTADAALKQWSTIAPEDGNLQPVSESSIPTKMTVVEKKVDPPKKSLSFPAKLLKLGRGKKSEDKTLKPAIKPFIPKLFSSRPATVGESNKHKDSSSSSKSSLKSDKKLKTAATRALKTEEFGCRSEKGIFQIDVIKGILGLGITVKAKDGHYLITDVKKSGPVGKSTFVRPGDYLVALNNTGLSGLADSRVQHMLKLVPRGTVSLHLSAQVPDLEEPQERDTTEEDVQKKRVPCLDGKSDSSRASSPREISMASSPDTSTDESSTSVPLNLIRSPPDGGESSPESKASNCLPVTSSSEIDPMTEVGIEKIEPTNETEIISSTQSPSKTVQTDQSDSSDLQVKSDDTQLGMTSSVDENVGSLDLCETVVDPPSDDEPDENSKGAAIEINLLNLHSNSDLSQLGESSDNISPPQIVQSLTQNCEEKNTSVEKNEVADVNDAQTNSNVVANEPVIDVCDVNEVSTPGVQSPNQAPIKPVSPSEDNVSSEHSYSSNLEKNNFDNISDDGSSNHFEKTAAVTPNSSSSSKQDVSLTHVDHVSEVDQSDAVEPVLTIEDSEPEKTDLELESVDTKITRTGLLLGKPAPVSFKPLTSRTIHSTTKSDMKPKQIVDNNVAISKLPREIESIDQPKPANIESAAIKTTKEDTSNAAHTASSGLSKKQELERPLETKTSGSLSQSSLVRSPGLKTSNKMNMFLKDDSKFKVPALKVGASDKSTVLSKPNSTSRLKGLQLPPKKSGVVTGKPTLLKLPKLGAPASTSVLTKPITISSSTSGETSLKRDNVISSNIKPVVNVVESHPPEGSKKITSSSFMPLKKFQPIHMNTSKLSPPRNSSTAEHKNSISSETSNKVNDAVSKKESETVEKDISEDSSMSSVIVKVNEAPAIPPHRVLTQSLSTCSDGLSMSSASSVFSTSQGSHQLYTPRSKRMWSLTSNSDVDSLHQSLSASMMSMVSLISQDELAELLNEANQCLDETGAGTETPIRVVVLHKSANEKLGIGIEKVDCGGFKITSIDSGSVAHTEHVQSGHFLLSVNGVTLKNLSIQEAEKTMSTSRLQVVLVLSPTMAEEQPSKSSDVNKTDILGDASTSSVNNDKPSVSEQAEEISSPPVSKSGGTTFVDLIKGKTGLGFCLEGGKDSPLGPQPIKVKRIFKGSLAALKGILSVGDELIQANGKEFASFTHHQAWNFLKSQPEGVIKIELRRAQPY